LLVDARPIVENVTPNLADEVQEFKAEIKADSRPTSKADFLAPAEPSIDGLKLDANRLQEQLSSLLSADRKQSEGAPAASVVPPSRQQLGDAAAKIFDMATEESAAAKMETAPVKSDASLLAHTPKSAKSPATSSFDDEEVKNSGLARAVARNAAIPAPASEKGASDSGAEFEERRAPEAVGAGSCAKTRSSNGKENGPRDKIHEGRSAIWQFSFRRKQARGHQSAPKRQRDLDGHCGRPYRRSGQRRVVFPRFVGVAGTRARCERIEYIASFFRASRFA